MPDTQRRQRDDLMVVLGAVPERIADLVSALDEPCLDYRHAPALPTLKELIGHFGASGAAVDLALRQAFVDGRRELRIREALDSSGDIDVSPPVGDLLDDFTRVRRRTVDLLRGLSPQDWSRPLDDPALGELDLYEACGMAVQHELGHLSQIRNLITLLPDPA